MRNTAGGHAEWLRTRDQSGFRDFLLEEIAKVEAHHPFAECACCGDDDPAKHLPCAPVVCAQWLRRILV